MTHDHPCHQSLKKEGEDILLARKSSSLPGEEKIRPNIGLGEHLAVYLRKGKGLFLKRKGRTGQAGVLEVAAGPGKNRR